jgi:hypothetical protein
MNLFRVSSGLYLISFKLLQAVVFCLVDIYIILGKAFVPYLEGLSSTQLRLVTIYASRISQARSGAPVDANQWVIVWCIIWIFVCASWVLGPIHLSIEQMTCLLHVFSWLAFLVWYVFVIVYFGPCTLGLRFVSPCTITLYKEQNVQLHGACFPSLSCGGWCTDRFWRTQMVVNI